MLDVAINMQQKAAVCMPMLIPLSHTLLAPKNRPTVRSMNP